MNLFCDANMDDSQRRRELYRGCLFIYSPTLAAVDFCAFAREMVEAAFHPYDPRKVQESLPVERCVEILAALKPAFIHHPKSKEFIRRMLSERGCDLERTYFDVPRLRSAFPPEYLASGIAYGFHPHRDTWYSAPFCQINWWLPVYDICPENGIAFHPRYWDTPVPNSSETYNYQEWNRKNRHSAEQHIKVDTRLQPRAQVSLEPDPKVQIVANVGGAILFSAAHLHSTVPNISTLTRYSIDFRTVHLEEITNKGGAPNIDSFCTGTTIRDYLRGSDYTPLPDEIASLYVESSESGGTRVSS